VRWWVREEWRRELEEKQTLTRGSGDQCRNCGS
jgi:hypothetical protein